MLPSLSMIIGAYVFTRMVELIVSTDKFSTGSNMLLWLCAGITIIVTIICLTDILNTAVKSGGQY